MLLAACITSNSLREESSGPPQPLQLGPEGVALLPFQFSVFANRLSAAESMRGKPLMLWGSPGVLGRGRQDNDKATLDVSRVW